MIIEQFRDWYWDNVVDRVMDPWKRLATAMVGMLACDYMTGLLNRETWRGEALYDECVKYIRGKDYGIICSIGADEFMEGLDKLAERITEKPALDEACAGWGIPDVRETMEESLERRMDELKRLASDGLNRTEIAAAMGVDRNAVGRAVKRHGIAIDPSKKRRKVGEEKEAANAKAKKPSALGEMPF